MFVIIKKKTQIKYPEKYVYYFAYGANINEKVMIRRSIKYMNKKLGKLKGYKLIFNASSNPLGFHYANIIRSNDKEVCGLIYKIKFGDLMRLKKFESGYNLKKMNIIANDDIVKCYIFCAKDNNNINKPLKEYKQTILDGYKQNNFPSIYTKELEEIEDISYSFLTIFYKFPKLIKFVDNIQSTLL